MCIANRQLGPAARRMRFFANLSLIAGLILWSFVHPSWQMAKNWHDGLSGLLLGFSITVNLLLLRRARRCCPERETGPRT